MTTHSSGGCQCGAVRFAVDEPLGPAGLCHCRMCQKAFGAPFAALVTVKALRWTRGAPSWFRSSDMARRGFCAACGTPLAYEGDGEPVEIAVCALDDPSAVTLRSQSAVESRVAWFDTLAALPGGPVQAPSGLVSRQHPDHDTDPWPIA
jgi:hypothetical protein